MTLTPLEEFGRQVRAARTAKGWTLTELAHQALGNQDRKSYVSRVELGRQPLTALSIQRFAKALDLPKPLIARMLGLPLAADDAPSPTEAAADRLLQATGDEAERLRIPEAMAIALAYEFAASNPANLETALKELRRAFEVAADQHARLSSNLGEAVDAVIAKVNALNDAGDIPGGTRALKDAMTAKKDRIAEEEQGYAALLAKGVAQAVLERSVPDAVAFILEQLDREAPDLAARFEALQAEFVVWFERGRDRGLGFDLEVAIALAENSLSMAQGRDQRGAVGNDLGVALRTLGSWEGDPARLVAAVQAFEAALGELSCERVPLK